MSKHRLVFDDDYEFLCFGLSCHLKDYKLAWTLNNHFRLELARKTLVVNTKQQANYEDPTGPAIASTQPRASHPLHCGEGGNAPRGRDTW